MRELQRVYLELGKKVIVPKTQRTGDAVAMKYPAAFALNMQSLGFMPSRELLTALSNLSYEEFVSVSEDIYSQLVKLAGSRANMVPMYPDFPEIMMSLSEEQLFVDAIIHYFSMGVWEARFQEKVRINTESLLSLKRIDLGTEDDLLKYIPMLANSSVAMSQGQKENLEFLIRHFNPIMNLSTYLCMNLNMKNKENMAYVIHMLYKNNMEAAVRTEASKAVKTSTDMLRVIMAFLGGDYTLASHKHDLKSLKRRERRMLLLLLNKVCKENKQVIEDASRYQGLWIVIGETLHPGDYANRFTYAYNFFKTLRDEKAKSWYSKVEKAYDNNDIESIIKLLSTRPGEFARRLERTMRLAYSQQKSVTEVVDAFATVAEKVDSTILLQIAQFFYDKTTNNHKVRTFMIKGSLAKTHVIEDDRDPMPPIFYVYASNVCKKASIAKYSEKEDIGKVYIDPAIKGYAIPLKLRTASKQLYSMARGSRVALPEEAKILRMYMWWKNPGHTDLDLTSMFLDGDFNKVTQDVSYWQLRNTEINCVHSGDIRSAQNGAAEFIDVPVEKLKEKGIKYVVMTVSSYSSEPFCDLTECFSGIMALDEIKQGARTFDPDKSLIRSDIASDATMNTPMVYDVDNHEMIWLDAPVTGSASSGPINTVTFKNSFINAVRGMVFASYPQFSTLVELHCLGRNAQMVDTPEEADIIFALDRGITPYSVEEINANWL